MATMNISLPDQLKKWVEDRVAEGKHSNASDYVRDLLRKDQSKAAFIAEINQAVADGVASGFHEMEVDDLFKSVWDEVDSFKVEKKSA